MNPIELYKELPKTNCGECGQKTCMAFAVAVSKGNEEVETCPYIDRSKVASLSKSVQKVDIREKIYENLRREIQKINLGEVAEGIGAEPVHGGVKISSLGNVFLISNDGEITSEGKVSMWAKIIMLVYIKTGGKGDLSNKWVSFEELKGGVVKIEALRKECEMPLTEIFENTFDTVMNKLKELGAIEVEGMASDHAWSLFLMPKIPVLLLCWRPDDEFPARVKLLFDSTADRFLDVESLVFLCEGLVNVLEETMGSRHI